MEGCRMKICVLDLINWHLGLFSNSPWNQPVDLNTVQNAVFYRSYRFFSFKLSMTWACSAEKKVKTLSLFCFSGCLISTGNLSGFIFYSNINTMPPWLYLPGIFTGFAVKHLLYCTTEQMLNFKLEQCSAVDLDKTWYSAAWHLNDAH